MSKLCARCYAAPRTRWGQLCESCRRLCSKCDNARAVRSNYCLSCKAAYQREWLKANPLSFEARQKDSARSTVGTNLRRGKIQKGLCEICGDAETIARIMDYDNPLIGLRWLCKRHHRDDVNAEAKRARRGG